MTAAVPIPPRMRQLPRDRRGYPIPVIVMWTHGGQPLFAANDEQARQNMFKQDRCHICGGKLLRGRWFVGGHLSTCAKHGLILDGGMHDECVHYALKVCPYLAARVYSGLVGAHQLAGSDRSNVVVVDTGTDSNPRPDLFVAVMAVGEEYSHGQLASVTGVPELEMIYGVKPKPGTVRKVEVWRHGRQVTDAAELAAVKADTGNAIAAAGDVWRDDAFHLWSLT